MRGRLAVVGAMGALFFTVAGPAGAAGGGAVTVGSTGTLGGDGTVALSGMYHCSRSAARGTVFVSSKLKVGNVSYGIGGTSATCDGREHAWTNRDKPSRLSVAPGPAEVEATLVRLSSVSGLPMPEIMAVDRHSVTLVADGG